MSEELRQFEFMATAMEEIEAAIDPAFVFARAKRFLRDFTGMAEHQAWDRGLLSIAQLVTSPDLQVKRFRKTTMPSTMLEVRLSADDFAHDPVITLAARTTNVFTWAEANLVATRRGRMISGTCAEHTGQVNGLVYPMVAPGLARGCASVGLDMDPGELSPSQIMMIGHVMTRAYVRLDALLGPFASDTLGDSLTSRELDMLRRIASGMSAAEAARDLGITPRTGNEYLDRAKRKTGTTKVAHTVAVAIATGLMLP